MVNRKALIAACALVSMLVPGPSVSALDNGKRTTYLSFNTPISLPGVSLPAGTYVFEIVYDLSTLDIVRVQSRDRARTYLTAFTRPLTRPAGMNDDRQIVFGETPSGTAPRISVWYPVGDVHGHQFVY